MIGLNRHHKYPCHQSCDGGNDDNNCHGDEGGDNQDDDIDGDDNKNDS